MSATNQSFFDAHPNLQSLDLLLPDLNGIVRGKRVKKKAAKKVFQDGILLPASLFGADICGDTVEATGLGNDSGDKDWNCRALTDTLMPVPWTDGAGAQCLLEMCDEDGAPFAAAPRHRLGQIVQRLHADGLFPTVAVELEFYLVRQRMDARGMPRLPKNPVTGATERGTQVYSMSDLDDFGHFIERVQQLCERQGVPAGAAIAEYAPGQFEINLDHHDDAVLACDESIYLKRIIRVAAKECGFTATFMAKPFQGLSGSGMHIHASVYDQQGDNRFAAEEGRLEHAVAGLQRTMNDGMLLWAPHANSYRRFQENAYVPLSPCWGYNNRTVALRVPAGPERARRIEHRVAGADANPYLVMAGVLAGLHAGWCERKQPDAPIEGNAAEQCAPSLLRDWLSAIDAFARSEWIADYLGEDLRSLLATIKRHEFQRFQEHVTPLEVRWYLRNV